MTCFINHTWYPSNTFTGIIPEAITQETGIKLDITVARDNRHLNLLLASGNIPDLIYTASHFELLSDPKYCFNYDDLIERFQIPWSISNDLRENALVYSKDNQIYTVINHYSRAEDWQNTAAVPMISSLCLREDLVSALGSPSITTLDELNDEFFLVKKQWLLSKLQKL